MLFRVQDSLLLVIQTQGDSLLALGDRSQRPSLPLTLRLSLRLSLRPSLRSPSEPAGPGISEEVFLNSAGDGDGLFLAFYPVCDAEVSKDHIIW